MASEIEGDYPPLPDDYTFNYSVSSPNFCGGCDEPDGDNDDDDLEIDLTSISIGNRRQKIITYV